MTGYLVTIEKGLSIGKCAVSALLLLLMLKFTRIESRTDFSEEEFP